jgi:phospholipid/cholesterol/gamma-HCH transport system permease protein
MTEAQFIFDQDNNQYRCTGNWSILDLGVLTHDIKTREFPNTKTLTINGSELKQFDSAGALMLMQCIDALTKQHNHIELTHFSSEQQDLLDAINSKREALHYTPPIAVKPGWIDQLGREVVYKFQQIIGLIILIGDVCDKLYRVACCGRRLQWPSVISNISSTGIYALPIVGLLSFLIGVVLAYQMGLQLETYGANIFIAYLSGMAIFREFAPLITAIIVAGRTSSAFTAQLGSMTINEEIDALLTMGLSPTELLVLPKILGLMLIFPLLIFWADVFGLLGAMLMSKSMLGIGYYDFMSRVQDSVGAKQLMLGLYKAPAFALLIALVGCFQGFRVQANADSVGRQTTKSVVQALFLIIITDAIYSVIYSWRGL